MHVLVSITANVESDAGANEASFANLVWKGHHPVWTAKLYREGPWLGKMKACIDVLLR